jgi:hypothetical protein
MRKPKRPDDQTDSSGEALAAAYSGLGAFGELIGALPREEPELDGSSKVRVDALANDLDEVVPMLATVDNEARDFIRAFDARLEALLGEPDGEERPGVLSRLGSRLGGSRSRDTTGRRQDDRSEALAALLGEGACFLAPLCDHRGLVFGLSARIEQLARNRSEEHRADAARIDALRWRASELRSSRMSLEDDLRSIGDQEEAAACRDSIAQIGSEMADITGEESRLSLRFDHLGRVAGLFEAKLAALHAHLSALTILIAKLRIDLEKGVLFLAVIAPERSMAETGGAFVEELQRSHGEGTLSFPDMVRRKRAADDAFRRRFDGAEGVDGPGVAHGGNGPAEDQ